jgi:hypothetical protein
MGYLEGSRGSGALASREYDRQEQHESRMRTEESDRTTSRLAQLESLQGIRDKEYTHTKDKRGEGQRAAGREQAIAEARAAQIKAEQDAAARQDLDSVSRLETAYRTGNQPMYDATLESMSPGTKEALQGVPIERLPEMLDGMRRIATDNLEQLRKYGQTDREYGGKRSVARTQGQEGRATAQQTSMNQRVTQQEADANANYRAEVGAGAPGMIARRGHDDPAQAKEMEDEYIASSIGAINRKGTSSTTQAEMNKAYDRAVSTGLAATAETMVSEYSGHGLPDIDNLEEWAEIPGWGAMRGVANKRAKMNKSGSDIHDYLSSQFILVDKDRGFIRMPVDADGELVGKLTARSLLQEARDTGQPIEDVVRTYERYIQLKHPDVDWRPRLEGGRAQSEFSGA